MLSAADVIRLLKLEPHPEGGHFVQTFRDTATVNGRPAAFRFVQPTYPGDPNGQNDPNPAAHEASQNNPVGGPHHNSLAPACSPELASTGSAPNSLNGTS